MLAVQHHGSRTALMVWSLAVQNSEQLGNHLVTAPGAMVDDGLLDLVATPPVGLFGALLLVGRMAAGTFGRAPGVTRLRSARFVIERAAPGFIHLDGEPCHATARLEIAILPRSLRVMAPAPDELVLLPIGPAELTTTP